MPRQTSLLSAAWRDFLDSQSLASTHTGEHGWGGGYKEPITLHRSLQSCFSPSVCV